MSGSVSTAQVEPPKVMGAMIHRPSQSKILRSPAGQQFPALPSNSRVKGNHWARPIQEGFP
jgi:hypothetical protein